MIFISSNKKLFYEIIIVAAAIILFLSLWLPINTNNLSANNYWYNGDRKETVSPNMNLTGEIIVTFNEKIDDETLHNFELKYNIKKIKTFDFSENSYLFRSQSPEESLKIANKIYESGEAKYSYPNWQKEMALK